uniref:Uncharacterized protein n=1 Tax=Utricularia reniformis TaxID=192314 RepID=A0A1Y0AZA9_9LAMI|nr:hypothetical protein AEK19_MT0187 [Utricularia reniformis]ART30469.1 hypothetical protein AEK19_MT0187 [Utricularia reniformis]
MLLLKRHKQPSIVVRSSEFAILQSVPVVLLASKERVR